MIGIEVREIYKCDVMEKSEVHRTLVLLLSGESIKLFHLHWAPVACFRSYKSTSQPPLMTRDNVPRQALDGPSAF